MISSLSATLACLWRFVETFLKVIDHINKSCGVTHFAANAQPALYELMSNGDTIAFATDLLLQSELTDLR